MNYHREAPVYRWISYDPASRETDCNCRLRQDIRKIEWQTGMAYSEMETVGCAFCFVIAKFRKIVYSNHICANTWKRT